MAKKFKSIKGGKDKSAPAAEETKATKGGKAPKAAKEKKAPAPRKYKGEKSGMSVTEFQNDQMRRQPKRKLSDDELAEELRAEFPNAIPYTTGHIVGIRSAYNHGKHGNDAPAEPVKRYVDGVAVAEERKARGAKKKTAASAPAKSAKPVKKVGKKAKSAPVEEEVEEDEEESEDESDE